MSRFIGITRFLLASVLAGSVPTVVAAAVLPFDLATGAGSNVAGTGRLNLGLGGGGAFDDIRRFRFEASTAGRIFRFDPATGDYLPDDVVHRFTYRLADIADAAGIVGTPAGVSGVLTLADKTASGGLVTLQALALDFDRGLLIGFCFASGPGPDLGECVSGGGTSTTLEAPLEVTLVPLPGALAAFGSGLLALGTAAALGRRRRLRA
jgi:hypothetical protein